METRAKYATIGFFTLLVVALAFGFVYWLKRLDESGLRKTMYLTFMGTVSGLEAGASVYFNGLKVGAVDSLSFDPANPNRIIVVASVRDDTPIKTDTTAKIGSSLLTGVAFIEMAGGSPTAPSVFAVTPPMITGQTNPDVVAVVNSLAQKVNGIVDRVDDFLKTNQESVKQSLDNVKEFTGALAKNSSGVSDFLKSVSDLSKTIQDLSGKLAGLVDKADKLVAAVDPDKVHATIDNVDKVVQRVADASNEVGGIVANVKKATADAADFTGGLKQTLAKVNDLVATFDRQKIATMVDDITNFADRLRTSGPDIDSIIADAKSTAANAHQFTDNLNAHNQDLNQIVADAKDLAGRLNESSKKLDTLLGKANDMLGTEGGKNFFAEATDAAHSIKTLADSLNAHVDEIAAGLEKFSSRGLSDVDALVTQLRGTATRIDRAVDTIANNPSSIVFGGNSGVREYNRH